MYLFSEEMISNCYLLTFFLVLNLISIHSYVVLPINILPKENYKSDYEANSPKDIMLKEFITSFYTEYEIGTEPQKIPMIIKQKINDYVVTSANPMTNPKRDYSEKVIYSLSENFLQKYKFFNESESSTVSLGTCKNRKPYDDDIEKPLAEQMCASTDTVLLYENVDLKEKVSEKEFHFDLVRNIEDNVPGIIGLALTDEYHQTSFLSVLKQKKLIENYNWFFDCEKWNSTSGKVVIGALPHEVYPDKYSIEDFYNDTIESSNNYFWEINFDSIFVKDKIFSSEIAGLDLESNLNIGSKEYKKYLESSIEELVTNEKCFKDSFKGYDEDNDFSTNYDFYYCKKDDDVKKQLSTFLTTISFQSKSSNFTFELTNEQLMKEDFGTLMNLNGYIKDNVPGIINVRFRGVEGRMLQTMLAEHGVCCSVGSACSSGEQKPSHVLKALKLSDKQANESIRFSLNYLNTKEEIDETIKILKSCISMLLMN